MPLWSTRTEALFPIKLVSQQENLKVEVLSHLELFHSFFYDIDASNYEKKLGESPMAWEQFR